MHSTAHTGRGLTHRTQGELVCPCLQVQAGLQNFILTRQLKYHQELMQKAKGKNKQTNKQKTTNKKTQLRLIAACSTIHLQTSWQQVVRGTGHTVDRHRTVRRDQCHRLLPSYLHTKKARPVFTIQLGRPRKKQVLALLKVGEKNTSLSILKQCLHSFPSKTFYQKHLLIF